MVDVNTLDDCGNVNAGITGGGLSAGVTDIGSGFTVAAVLNSLKLVLLTKRILIRGSQLPYTADTYGASITYSSNETGTEGAFENNYTAVNAYWTPDGFLQSVLVMKLVF